MALIFFNVLGMRDLRASWLSSRLIAIGDEMKYVDPKLRSLALIVQIRSLRPQHPSASSL